MRLHFILNHGGTPESKLADVEIHFEEGILAGLKLVGCSVWRSRERTGTARNPGPEGITVLIPSRPYSTAGGMRYFDLLRPSVEGDDTTGKAHDVRQGLKDRIREEYATIMATNPDMTPKAEE